MRVDHGRPDIGMTQERLDGADVKVHMPD
jgi:hypothetical protein